MTEDFKIVNKNKTAYILFMNGRIEGNLNKSIKPTAKQFREIAAWCIMNADKMEAE